MTDQGTQERETAAIEAALVLFAERGYRATDLNTVAERLGWPREALRGVLRDKPDAVLRLLDQVDSAVLGEDAGFTPEDGVKDRLFDLLMRRFDGLAPFKLGLRAVTRDMPRDPCLTAAIGAYELRALSWYLDAAGVSTGGIGGLLRTKGLVFVWTHCLKAWLTDESEDSAKTMAALDTALSRAGRAAAWMPGAPSSPGDPEPVTAP